MRYNCICSWLMITAVQREHSNQQASSQFHRSRREQTVLTMVSLTRSWKSCSRTDTSSGASMLRQPYRGLFALYVAQMYMFSGPCCCLIRPEPQRSLSSFLGCLMQMSRVAASLLLWTDCPSAPQWACSCRGAVSKNDLLPMTVYRIPTWKNTAVYYRGLQYLQ